MNTQNPEIQESNHAGLDVWRRRAIRLWWAGAATLGAGALIFICPQWQEEQEIPPGEQTLDLVQEPATEWVTQDLIDEGIIVLSIGAATIVAAGGLRLGADYLDGRADRVHSPQGARG